MTLVVLGGSALLVGGDYRAEWGIEGTESDDGAAILEDSFPDFSAGPGGTIVFRARQGIDDPEVRGKLSGLFEGVEDIDDVVVVSPYDPGGERLIATQGSETGLTAYAEVSVGPSVSGNEATRIGAAIDDLIEDMGLRSIDGLEVEVGGITLAEIENPESETLGLAFAMFVLIAVLGSVVAMGVTVGTALLTVAVGSAGIVLLSNLTTVPEFAPLIGLTIGLGVGIDYSLFIITRYREGLDRGLDSEQAMVAALESSGRSVIFAGTTVLFSLLGMLLMGVSFVNGFAIAAAAAVAVVMIGSVTLLPSLVALAGDRITTTRVRGMAAAVLVSLGLLAFGAGAAPLLTLLPMALAAAVMVAGFFGGAGNPLRRALRPRREKPIRETVWYRLSRVVQGCPKSFAVGGIALLLLLTAPVLVMRFGFADESNYSPETTTRKAHDLLVDAFGPGAGGPLLIVAETAEPAHLMHLGRLSQQLDGTAGVASVSPPIPSPHGRAAVIRVQPDTGPQDEATSALVHTLRDDVIPSVAAGTGLDAMVTGLVAVRIDLSDFLRERTALFFIVVLGASFLLLTAVFRSLVVPLKAVVMNMLSIGAAYGVMVAVFQWGWLGGFAGISPGPIDPFLPMMLFAVLFGLSMDYEVFLLSRMREEFQRTGDAANSIADGLAATAKVITAAALIMVFVFGSVALEDNRVVKMFAVGLAVAVAVDASLVRLLVVPSTMELLGARNWWLPGWIDRVLPNVKIDADPWSQPPHSTRAPHRTRAPIGTRSPHST